MKRHKDMTLKDKSPRLVGVQYATGKKQEIASEEMKRLSHSRNDAQLWICLGVEIKPNPVKNNIEQEPGMLGP